MANATTPKVHMGTLTGDEGRAIYATNPVILLPMGSQEDQGPHAPMGDYLLAEKIAELAALRGDGDGHAHPGGPGDPVRRRRLFRRDGRRHRPVGGDADGRAARHVRLAAPAPASRGWS